ncbi:hypothetical protein K2A28_004494 [Salmonella enterica subsp. enterica serovar Muenchen]|nr:hypothetical protein [Salmonella enterica subsp. enterica serovar Muenchen]EEI2331358.1 hypothetical protein [Salmonella enterica subsp. enterica serovar Muenchen]EGF1507007.1 hypothetical protein [Salmonella enterica subsp. enterica serovar Muenchen]EHA9519124.1 hypothetical protein [Salmonella enterica subsp. enterica serovar Muenchen]EHX7075432.1 hypothetical protein [Salmonella enterica subsp. enterica serovar Muenchen]
MEKRCAHPLAFGRPLLFLISGSFALPRPDRLASAAQWLPNQVLRRALHTFM